MDVATFRPATIRNHWLPHWSKYKTTLILTLWRHWQYINKNKMKQNTKKTKDSQKYVWLIAIFQVAAFISNGNVCSCMSFWSPHTFLCDAFWNLRFKDIFLSDSIFLGFKSSEILFHNIFFFCHLVSRITHRLAWPWNICPNRLRTLLNLEPLSAEFMIT